MTTQSLLTNKLRDLLQQVPNLPKAFALVWEAARPWTVVWIGLLLIQGLLPIATVYLTRAIVDSLVTAIDSGGTWETVRPTLIFVVAMAGILLVSEALRSLSGWIRAAQSELVQDHITDLIHHQSTAVDLAFYEMPEYYDQLHRARAQASTRPLELVESLGGLLQSSITLVAMAAVLFPFGSWLPFALLISTLPALFVVLRHGVRLHLFRRRTTEDQRRTWYYNWLLTSGETAAEIRLFRLGPHFRQAYSDVRTRLRGERLALARSESLSELAAGAFGLLITGAALAWMVWRAVQGRVTLGDLAMFYQAFHQGQRLMRTLLENVGRIYSSSLFLGDLFEYLDLTPKIVEPSDPKTMPARLTQGIRFEGVTFQYPGSRRTALEDFSLDIAAGQIVAIVGANGAGKTTLIKLLSRFYDPPQGTIQIDGVDLERYSIADLRRQISVLFQQPVHYNDTVSDNIRFGDVSAALPHDEIVRAAQSAGATSAIDRLSSSYDTILGRWFTNGAELSIGEWQRISLARAFYRDAPIILLDEPTSAMDSWAETDWMARFRTLVEDRTAILITHRFTTAMRADVIHVMDQGRIVEHGNHDDLLSQDGLYARSWHSQMSQATPRPTVSTTLDHE
jgi:ATP-binding cassette subfamily B protein